MGDVARAIELVDQAEVGEQGGGAGDHRWFVEHGIEPWCATVEHEP